MFKDGFIEYMEMIGEQIGLAVENSMSFVINARRGAMVPVNSGKPAVRFS